MANKESGFPSNRVDFIQGPTSMHNSFALLPVGFDASAPAASVSPHQEPGDTRTIGMPGTDYAANKNDEIYRTQAGHMIVFGGAPGDETMRIHPVQGGAIEIGPTGVKISSAQNFHMSISSEGQIILGGDLSITTSGAFNLKCGVFNVECGDYNLKVAGDEIVNVQGTASRSVDGDNQVKVLGDSTNMTAGDISNITAGNYRQIVSGNVSMGNLGSFNMTSKGSASFGTQGNFTASSQGNTSINTQGNFSAATTGDSSINTKGKSSIASSGDMTVSSQGAQTVSAKGAQSVTSSGGTTVASSGSTTVSGSSTAIMGSSGIAMTGSGITSSTPVTTGGSGTAPTISEPTAPEISETKVKVDVPETKQLIENMSDYVQTDGAFDKIYTMAQLEEAYDVEEGGQIPEKVMSRAKELGIADNYKPLKQETAETTSGVHYGSDNSFNFNV